MSYELVKNEFMQLKKEQLNYIDSIARISCNKTLSENEKLEFYRELKIYDLKLNELRKNLRDVIIENNLFTKDGLNDVIIEFTLEQNYLSSLDVLNEQQKKYLFEDLGIDMETLKFKLTLYNLIYTGYKEIDLNIIQNNQKLIENPIYIFSGYYDSSEDCYGPLFGNIEDYIYGTYENIESIPYSYYDKHDIPKKMMNNFEKDKIVIHSKEYVQPLEIKIIFEKELLNVRNRTLDDCVKQTRNRIDELNYIRSPEYKEKILLDRINDLYKRVKCELIREEILCSGNFLQILREIYKLPNENTMVKEKIIKNDGKDSVIIIAITQENEYIITIQNRIKDKLIAEFPSGYIENNKDPIDTARRELKEETGYISNDLFLIDEAYTSPGTDNSKSYIVIANNCIKSAENNVSGTELVEYGLFSQNELQYLICKNIMIGAMNKLAYYNLINNVNGNGKNYKKLRKKRNPLDN